MLVASESPALGRESARRPPPGSSTSAATLNGFRKYCAERGQTRARARVRGNVHRPRGRERRSQARPHGCLRGPSRSNGCDRIRRLTTIWGDRRLLTRTGLVFLGGARSARSVGSGAGQGTRRGLLGGVAGTSRPDAACRSQRRARRSGVRWRRSHESPRCKQLHEQIDALRRELEG